ncbi:MAG: nucleoside-triphosphatase [Streptosporangiaceae bacterium]
MGESVPRILLTGPPRSGKTTLACRLIQELAGRGTNVGGFITRELREDGKRTGFTVAEIGGRSALLAHVTLPEGPRVGRYRVDVAAFESIALPAIERARDAGVAVFDELGLMELLSPPFIASFTQFLDCDVPLVATIHARTHPVTDAIRRRPGIQLLQVRPETSSALLARLTAQLALCRTRARPAAMPQPEHRAAFMRKPADSADPISYDGALDPAGHAPVYEQASSAVPITQICARS